MRQSLAAIVAIFVASSVLYAQKQAIEPALEKSNASLPRGYFVDAKLLDLALILPPPPAQSSEITKTELAELHQIEDTRTQQQVALAQADDREEDIFIFKDVLGQNFTAESLPLTAALSAHIHHDEGVASKPLKASFSRPRPFQFDSTLHPVCALTKEHNSYPSGHTLSGYLLALTLVQIVPEKKEQIMERADNYAHNRLTCGVHYASDIEASRRIAYAAFGFMLANPEFQKELTAAKAETRLRLGLP